MSRCGAAMDTAPCAAVDTAERTSEYSLTRRGLSPRFLSFRCAKPGARMKEKGEVKSREILSAGE